MEFIINNKSSILYTNLSFRDYFSKYNPLKDGKVYIATYGFIPRNFDFWSKLEPNSAIYIHSKEEKNAKAFLRRFPIFEIHSIENLHSKVVFFYKSSKLLIGSENLCLEHSQYHEVMLETIVPHSQKEKVIDMVFKPLIGNVLTCNYTFSDLKLHKDGHPYFPCETEVTYWDLLVSRISFSGKPLDPEYHSPSYIYYLLDYEVNNKHYYLAFNRGYLYCGDIDFQTFNWLISNCEIIQKYENEKINNSTADDLSSTSLSKDYFMTYHPIASKFSATNAYWLGPVKNLNAYSSLIKSIRLIDITKKKIRR